jgi:hypothetical protein
MRKGTLIELIEKHICQKYSCNHRTDTKSHLEALCGGNIGHPKMRPRNVTRLCPVVYNAGTGLIKLLF